MAKLDEIDDDPYGEEGDDDDDEWVNEHLDFLRLKVMALLAIMDGLEQPTDLHWEAAGLVIELSEICAARTRARAEIFIAADDDKQGSQQGRRRAAAARGQEEAANAYDTSVADRIIEVVMDLGGSETYAAIHHRLGKKQRGQAKRILDRLVQHGSLSYAPATLTYTLI